MNFPSSMSATGSLFGAMSDDWSFPDLSALGDVNMALSERRGWAQLEFASPIPLTGEVVTEGAEYLYHFLVKRSGGHLLVASTHAVLVTKLLDKLRIRRM